MHFDVKDFSEQTYSLKEACDKHTKISSPINEIESVDVISCMGKRIKVKDFCNKELLSSPLFIRGVALQKSRQIKCQLGSALDLSYKCKKEDKSIFCKSAKSACLKIKDTLAGNLHYYSGNLKDISEDKVLDCRFAHKAYFKSKKLPKVFNN